MLPLLIDVQARKFSAIIASMLPLREAHAKRKEVIPMLDVLASLAVDAVSSAVGTVIGTVVGLYIYDRWFK